MPILRWMLPAALGLACGGHEDATLSETPPAALIAPVRESMSLAQRLERLERELVRALDAELSGDGVERLLRAEAITDRLLEAEPVVAWLPEGYDAGARLRQLQSLADRAVARLRRGEPREQIMADVALLRQRVRALRLSLAQPGGGAAPIPLDSLLAAVPAENERRAVAESGE